MRVRVTAGRNWSCGVLPAPSARNVETGSAPIARRSGSRTLRKRFTSTLTGAEIVGGIPGLKHLSPGLRYHHERWDGTGYPEGLSGHRIPMVAQILGVCDTYDAMTSGRVYRSACSHRDTLDEISHSSGSQFGPGVVEHFVQLPGHVFQNLWSPEKTLEGWLQRTLWARRRFIDRSRAS